MKAKKTSFRFAIAMRILSKLALKPPQVVGLGNLTEIPGDKSLVIASSHLSDIDVQTIAANIAIYKNVGIASQASNQRHPVIGTFLRIAGIENVFGITNEYDTKKRRSIYTFNPEDFERMKNAIKNGKTIIIAAHKPAYEWKLPDNSGLGAVYLAQISRATILPAAVDVQYPEFIDLSSNNVTGILKRLLQRKRLEVKVTFGEPIRLALISPEKLTIVAKFLNRRERHKMAIDEIEKSRVILEKLRLQGSEVMESLANMLPQNKRGRWQNA